MSAYSTAAKNARLNAVVTLLNGGKLEIGTAGMAAVLATFTLNATAGTVSGGVLTLSGFPKAVAASAAGTAAAARLRDSSNADVLTGLTVGTSGTDIVLDTTTVNAGQNVNIAANPTITHA